MSLDHLARSHPSAALSADLVGRFTAAGIAIIEYALSKADLAHLDALFPRVPQRTVGARTSDITSATETWLTDHDGLNQLAARLGTGGMHLSHVAASAQPHDMHWFVPWHQDRAGHKADRSQSQLERVIALHIHLDDCEDDNGPLEVIPGSHLSGRLDTAAMRALVATSSPLLCLAVRGDIVAVRPLLVHRSQRARLPSPRRTLHLEYEPNS